LLLFDKYAGLAWHGSRGNALPGG